MNFNELGLEEALLKAVKELGFEEPTLIQEKAIPTLLLEDKDLVGLAQTGTGKTAAFGLPLLQKVDPTLRKVQGLVLSPTRELCMQIAEDLAKFGKYKKVSTLAVYGGTSIDRQISAIKRGTQVVIATPGRLNDLIKRREINLSEVEVAVLDEADEMLNMGFKDELDAILEKTPVEKNTWLFSATMPKEVRRIASDYMTDPLEVNSGKINSTNKNIDHQFVVASNKVRYEALKRVIDFNPDIFAVIFCRTKRETQEVADKLTRDGYNSDALHGDLSQAQRDRVMKKFRDKTLSVLVATDVAARGIDVNDVTHVIHHQLPEDVENYTHRSGRTARAGKKGVSIALVSPRDQYKIRQLEKITGAVFTKIQAPSAEEICERKLFNFAEELKESEVDKSIEKYSEKLDGLFEGVSKEELIKKIASIQLKALFEYYSEHNDLSDEGSRERNSDMDRFFINLGSLDDLDRETLKELLVDLLGLDKESIGIIDIKDSFSFFEYKKGSSKQVLEISDIHEYNGRGVRIEESKGRRSSGGGGRNSGGGRNRKFNNRSGRGGGSDRRRSGGGNRDSNRGGGYSRNNNNDFNSRRGGGDSSNRGGGRDNNNSSENKGGGRRKSSGSRRSGGNGGNSNFGFLDSSLTY